MSLKVVLGIEFVRLITTLNRRQRYQFCNLEFSVASNCAVRSCWPIDIFDSLIFRQAIPPETTPKWRLRFALCNTSANLFSRSAPMQNRSMMPPPQTRQDPRPLELS
jgi:hypothetical protein